MNATNRRNSIIRLSLILALLITLAPAAQPARAQGDPMAMFLPPASSRSASSAGWMGRRALTSPRTDASCDGEGGWGGQGRLPLAALLLDGDHHQLGALFIGLDLFCRRGGEKKQGQEGDEAQQHGNFVVSIRNGGAERAGRPDAGCRGRTLHGAAIL